jgi:glycosyltransferase involved in cell wall biosynthesis
MLHFFWTPYRFALGAYERYESANAEFVKYARQYFEGVTATHMAHYNCGRVTERPEDILLGHPTWDTAWNIENRCYSVTDDWVRDNALTPDAPCHPNTYVMIPWLPFFPPEAHVPFAETQYTAARRIFAVCGDYWFKKTMALNDGSIQSRVRNKLVRIDMGCAAHLFPCKTLFSKENRRNLLHVSNLGPAKNIPLMLESLAGLDVNLSVASGQLKTAGPVNAPVRRADGTTRAHTFRSLGRISNNDPAINRNIIENYDFYLHTSRYDAQATVILENAARGLVPLVTPESGFACPHAVYLTQDPEQNRDIIQRAVHMSDEEYAVRSRGVRDHVIEHHNWDRIYGRIWSEIQTDIDGRSAGAPEPDSDRGCPGSIPSGPSRCHGDGNVSISCQEAAL